MILKKELNNLNPKTSKNIEDRLAQFAQLGRSGNQDWFNELCFCILTANSKAETAIKIQNFMGDDGFIKKTKSQIALIIKQYGHRFHNNKAKYIVEARNFLNIKDRLKGLSSSQARQFLVKNIKGIGFKEASHFLRNVNYKNVAIIDRHVLRFLLQEKLINQIPKTITPKSYLLFEKILEKFNISQNKLDLIIWEKMTGKVLK